MGFNTTIVVLNDMLNEIERDPDFGKKLVSAIRQFQNPDGMPYVPGQTQVIGQHHADGALVYVVGGNRGRLLGHGGDYADSDDDIIKELWRQRQERRRSAKNSSLLIP